MIDIGSNSVRLVVYGGSRRVPFPIFNEKVLAGLGSALAETGAIGQSAAEKALGELRRFKLLIGHLENPQIHVIATAAVRDASNGLEFAREVRALGLPCNVLGPDEEARLAGQGVLSAIPDADGIVGDLGGGSLELVEVAEGKTSNPISTPLGVLRANRNAGHARDLLREALATSGLARRGRGREFYMVGGSWRALARIDMLVTGHPLPCLQQYGIEPGRVKELERLVRSDRSRWAKRIAPARLASSPVAAMLLATIAEEVRPSRFVICRYGIREGLLYSALPQKQRMIDPLIEAARVLNGSDQSLEAGNDLGNWLSRAFDDPPALARLRLTAACLASCESRAGLGFRADRAVETALHGDWVGVDPAGRILIAQALSSAFGRDTLKDERLLSICDRGEVERARHWGLAMRMALRLSAGITSILQDTDLCIDGGMLKLRIPAGQAKLVNDSVQRRLSRLAQAMALEPLVEAV